MNLTAQQYLLLEFVKMMHGRQKRKYTFEPYWNHPYQVAEKVSRYKHINDNWSIEIALCHDLFEDTECTEEKLFDFLTSIGYKSLSFIIVEGVQDLTDVYTIEKYPKLNRKERKLKETIRLSKTQSHIQSIKYVDVEHNTASIIEHDIKFAKVYVPEKMELIDKMRGGDINLLIDCGYVLKNAAIKLNEA